MNLRPPSVTVSTHTSAFKAVAFQGGTQLYLTKSFCLKSDSYADEKLKLKRPKSVFLVFRQSYGNEIRARKSARAFRNEITNGSGA